MRVQKRNNLKGGDVRDTCTSLGLVATEESERIFLARLGEAILDGTPIAIGDVVYDRVRVTAGEPAKRRCPACGKEVGRNGRFFSAHKVPLASGPDSWCEGGQMDFVSGG
jgi:hypothetical protein